MGQLVVDTDIEEAFFVVKGSDTAIGPLLKLATQKILVDNLTTKLAQEGLRTLVFAVR
jgi:magnesium-transporting ATPase (P-type)